MAPQATALKDNRIIHSLDKGLIILELLERADDSLSLNDIYLELKWERATIHRLLETLRRRGFVLRHADSRRYSLGLHILSLNASLQREFDVQAVARPILKELTERFGEGAHLAIPIGDHMVFVASLPGTEAVTVSTDVGGQAPMHSTAIGKCFLAFDKRMDLSSRFENRLGQNTPKTLSTFAALEQDLAVTAKRGYAIDDQEHRLDVRCVAAPIMGSSDIVIAAIGISAPKYRMSLPRLNEIGRDLVAGAAAIEVQYEQTDLIKE